MLVRLEFMGKKVLKDMSGNRAGRGLIKTKWVIKGFVTNSQYPPNATVIRKVLGEVGSEWIEYVEWSTLVCDKSYLLDG